MYKLQTGIALTPKGKLSFVDRAFERKLSADRAFNEKTYLRANESYRSFFVGPVEIAQSR